MIVRVIDILSWLDADTQPPAARALREQQLVSQGLPRDPFRRVLAWWRLVSAQAGSQPSGGERWLHQYRRLVFVLLCVGVIAGISTMTGVAVIDRGEPINLLLVAAIFLVLPTVGWLLSLAGMVWRAHSTGLRHGGLFGAEGFANRWLERSTNFQASTRTWPANVSSALVEAHLQMLPQWFTVGLFVGSLLALVALVIFTDLAFGWSTTIEMAAGSVYSVCRWLSLPWSGWLPGAVPDLALIEASRFFRLEDRDLDRASAVSLGQWWPFVAMCILVWGLLPRLLLMVGVQLQIRRACRRMLLGHPEVQALLERLQAGGLAVTAGLNRDGEGRLIDPKQAGMRGPGAADRVTLVWNDCLAATTSGDLPEPFRSHQVNVRQTDAQWAALASSLEEVRGNTLEVLVAGWEPPSLSLRDFLLVLNRNAVRARDILIVPVNVAGAGVDAAERLVWTSTLAGWGIENVSVADDWSRP